MPPFQALLVVGPYSEAILITFSDVPSKRTGTDALSAVRTRGATSGSRGCAARGRLRVRSVWLELWADVIVRQSFQGPLSTEGWRVHGSRITINPEPY